MWVRYVRYQASSQCCYEGNAMLYRGPLIFPERALIGRFRKRPIDDIYGWADKIIRDTVFEFAENACKELADEYEACDVESGIIYTSEVIVGEKRKREIGIPDMVRIEGIKELIKTAVTAEQKKKYQDMIDSIMKKYE